MDLPMSSGEKSDPKEGNPNWLSMRTGGQFTKFQVEGGDADEYRLRKERVDKAIEDDRKLIEEAQKANAQRRLDEV